MPPDNIHSSVALKDCAVQHGPRPLPLFLQILSQYTGDNPQLQQKVLRGLRRYQNAPRKTLAVQADIVDSKGEAKLLAPKFTTRPDNSKAEVIFVPSPINSPDILDLDEGHSLVSWLADLGIDSLIVNWGKVDQERAGEDAGQYAMKYLVPFILRRKKPVHLVGYCLGGVITMAAAVHCVVKSMTIIATPWDFSSYCDDRRAKMQTTWAQSKAASQQWGAMPMEVLQQGFWQLSGRALINKYAALSEYAEGAPEIARFVAMEDWVNGGEPLPFAFGKQIFTDFYGRNITGKGQWNVAGKIISPNSISCPVLEFCSNCDDIVPLAASPQFSNRHILDQGHVGMVAGSKAKTLLWAKLRHWLEQSH